MQPASSLDARWPDLIAAVSTVIDLDATARTSRALIRRRGIRSAAMLLRLALAYGPGGLSLRAAAAWAGASGLADLSDTAVMNRLRQAADWLGEIAGALLRRAAAAPAAAGPLPGRAGGCGSPTAAWSPAPAAGVQDGDCTRPTTRWPAASPASS
jgi:hypothetical protein